MVEMADAPLRTGLRVGRTFSCDTGIIDCGLSYRLRFLKYSCSRKTGYERIWDCFPFLKIQQKKYQILTNTVSFKKLTYFDFRVLKIYSKQNATHNFRTNSERYCGTFQNGGQLYLKNLFG